MQYRIKIYPFAIALPILLSTTLFSQTNKPVTTSQVPAPSQVVVAVPGAYNANGQTPVVNYVRTRQALGRITDVNSFDAAGYREVNEATQYVDGLGRPLQTIMRQATPGTVPSDIVSPIIYDALGREVNKYLPYVQTGEGNGLFKNDPFNAQKAFYQTVYPSEQPAFNGEQVYYNQVNYETSPLNRPVKALAPGNSWTGQNIGVEQQYLINTAGDAVRIWDIANVPLTYAGGDISTNIPTTSAIYEAGELYKNVTKDEQGNVSVEYKDKEGLVVLKKVQAGQVAADYSGYTGFLCTYYVYDDFNHLRFVIPPKAVAALINSLWNLTADPMVISELCFRYEYDGRNRLIAKKVPGADWVYMIYDNRDRLILTQDSYLRGKSCWLGTAYDPLNRPVMTGFYYPSFSGPDPNPTTPAALQSLVTKYSDENNTDNIVSVQPPPEDLYVSVRHKDDNETYKAIRSVTFSDEFQAETNPEFHTEIVVDGFYNWINSYTTISGNLYDYHVVPTGGTIEFLDNFFEPLTITHYDDYEWTSQGFTDRYNTKLSAGNNLHAEALFNIAQQAAVSTRGMVTGTEARIMPTIDYVQVSSYRMLYTIPFYDDRGRVVQTQSNNYKNGTDIQTSLYDFTGKVLSNYLIHTNLDAGMLNLRVQTDMEYDAGSRLTKTWKAVNDDPATKTLIVQNEYDVLGKLKRKSLGQTKDVNGVYTTTPLETLDYHYNIRGWLKGINGDYANKTGGANNWFGMDLSYDYGFDHNQLNGNIAGIKWRSAGDGEQRAYGYGYDAVNRLMYADFNQLFSSSWQKQDPNSSFLIDFSTIMGDGSTTASAYDQNGNILAMKQWGLKLNSSQVIDDLAYNYKFNGSTNTNKLLNVIDGQSDDQTKLGDFHYSPTYTTALNGPKTAAAIDYVYDANGNMTKDYNKDISGGSYSGILYNFLNLPVNIGFAHAYPKRIEYTYDASGNKLSKSVIDGTKQPGQIITKNTDYIGGMVYQDNVLQFIGQKEGRIRYKPKTASAPESFVYDYFIKDHLGNVRMVLTDEQQTDTYLSATMETANAANENALYSKIDATRTDITSASGTGYPTDTYTSPNDYAAKVSGSVGGNKIGPGIVLKVMKGDKFSVYVSSWYKTNGASINQPVSPLTDLLAALAGGISGMPDAHGSGTLAQNSSTLSPAITEFLNGPGHSAGTDRPKAFLNWVLLDEQFRLVGSSSGADPVPAESEYGNSNPSSAHVKAHVKTDLPVNKSGYLYIYVSNETPNIDVFFDNLKVIHNRGPLLEETHYYPFGLQIPGISSRANKGVEYAINRKGFNGNELQSKEFNDGSGLDNYDFNARTYDPQTGRFLQIDPESEEGDQESWTLYHFAYNNPILRNDPTGRFPGLGDWMKAAALYTAGRIQGAVSVVAGGLQQQYNNAKLAYTYATNPQFRKTVNNGLSQMVNHPKEASNAIGQFVTKSAGEISKSVTDPKNLTANNVGKAAGTIEGNALLLMAGKLVPSTPAFRPPSQIIVDAASIQKALEGSTMKTVQGAVSVPAVERYVRLLENGSPAPAISVAEGNVIVDGNHRYVAGRLFGAEPAITPGTLSPSSRPLVRPVQELKLDFTDWFK